MRQSESANPRAFEHSSVQLSKRLAGVSNYVSEILSGVSGGLLHISCS